MGVIVQQSIRNTLISYLGIALGFVSTILLFPHILTPDQYGLTRVLISVSMIGAQFAQLGAKSSIIRFFPYFNKNAHTRSGLLLLSFLQPLAGFLLFGLAFLLFEEQLVAYYTDQSGLFSDYYLYLLPLVFSMLFFEVLNSYIRALQDSVTGSFLNEVLVRFLLIVLLLLYSYTTIEFELFIIYFTGIYMIQPVYLVIYLLLKGELNFGVPRLLKKHRFLKSFGTYGAYSLIGGMTILLVNNIDILMLGAMTDLANAGTYAIAFYIATVITIPQRSINKIAAPILSGFIKHKKSREVYSLYQRTSINQIVAGSLLLMGIWANMDNIMYLLPTEYHDGRWVIILIGLAKLFDMATGINGGIIINSQYYRVNLYLNLLLVIITVATNYFLIPVYGILGAAIATAFSVFLYNLLKFLFVWKTFSMQPFTYRSFLPLIISAGCLWLSHQIPYLVNFYVDVIVRSLILGSLFIGLVLFLRICPDLKELLRNLLMFLTTGRSE